MKLEPAGSSFNLMWWTWLVRNWHKEKNQGKRKSQFSWGDVSWWQLNIKERRLDRWFGSKVECYDSFTYFSPLIFLIYLGIGMGNPGVFPGYPYPNPSLPVPAPTGTGFDGYGLRVLLTVNVTHYRDFLSHHLFQKQRFSNNCKVSSSVFIGYLWK